MVVDMALDKNQAFDRIDATGYANGAALTACLNAIGGLEISVSAYPEKHPESRDTAADIDMLKQKADNGATRALTQADPPRA